MQLLHGYHDLALPQFAAKANLGRVILSARFGIVTPALMLGTGRTRILERP